MTCELFWSSAAERDLEEIWDHIAESDIAAADRTVRKVGELLTLLGETPKMGRQATEIDHDWRILVRAPYLIFYHHNERSERIEIARIVHERRDLAALLD